MNLRPAVYRLQPVIRLDGEIISGAGREFTIKDTHRGLYYEDGKLTKLLEAGRYKIPPRHRWFRRLPNVECLLVE